MWSLLFLHLILLDVGGEVLGQIGARDPSQFLFVPPGREQNDGLVLSEVKKDSLPPGEYEVVAMFEKPQQKQQHSQRQNQRWRQQQQPQQDRQKQQENGWSLQKNVFQQNQQQPRQQQQHYLQEKQQQRQYQQKQHHQPQHFQQYQNHHQQYPTQPQQQHKGAPSVQEPQPNYQYGGNGYQEYEPPRLNANGYSQIQEAQEQFQGPRRQPEQQQQQQQQPPYRGQASPDQYTANGLSYQAPQKSRHRVENMHKGGRASQPGGRASQRRAQERKQDMKMQNIADSFFEVSRGDGYQHPVQPSYSNQLPSTGYSKQQEIIIPSAPNSPPPGPPKSVPSRPHLKNNLQKLYEIVNSNKEFRNTKSNQFTCPQQDGHFGDPVDCAKFYRCAHGSAIVEYCPGGLYYNTFTEQCDWPESVDCQYTTESLAKFKVNEPTTIYLTFDDGPGEGTEQVLKALRNEGVKATFFVNSQYLHDKDEHKTARNKNLLLAGIVDNHIIADHSYDHMYHNSFNTPNNAYKSIQDDSKYFGVMNIYPVLDLLWKHDLKDYIARTNYTMSSIVRMPYTNNWRVGEIKRDCVRCTVPNTSGQNGVEIANVLQAQGKKVFGWDTEWEINWDTKRFKYSGKDLFFKLSRQQHRRNKIVILSHDIAYKPNPQRDEQESLQEFIRLAKNSGYKFDTLDNY